MTTTKSTKRALLMSGLALLMCVSMLVGGTFAWFTDSVTSSGNIIKSGTLDVTMEWADGTTDPANTTWNDAAEGAIFNYDLWEPGYTEVRHIKIANVGTLALKYQLSIIANGEVSKLADVIDVYYVDPAEQIADRTALTADMKLGTLTEVLAAISTTASGNLEAGKNHTITLALKMQENAGNEYQGLSIGSDFSVQLLATQLTHESDSFDDQYDSDLETAKNGVSRVLDDGSTVFYYNEESDYYGRVRLIDLPENLGSEYVVPAEVNDLGGALVGITLDNLTIPAGVQYAYKSLEGATIGEVILEEGATMVPNRMFYKTKVDSIEIPSSVTVIEENAFAQATAETLVIPASVATVGEAAFQHMPNLTTVTFEGNTAIEGYAFRGCAKLRTVYLNGENVTFVTSATGKNSCWFCNSESNNPGTSNITFYVKNETVAARVRTAMGAELPSTTPIYIGEKLFVTAKNATEFQAALNAATVDTIINLTADITGNVNVMKNAGVDLTINGNGKKFTGIMSIIGDTATGSLTVKGINFVAASGAKTAINCPEKYTDGGAHNNYLQNVTIENCTFTDPDGDRSCVAINHEGNGQKNWLLKNCTVDSSMHSFMQVNNIADSFVVDECYIYSKNGINVNQSRVLTVIGSTFDVTGYAIRCGATAGEVGYAETYLVKGCTLKSACDDGDAVIILRATADNATLTIEETTIDGEIEITNQATGVTINR